MNAELAKTLSASLLLNDRAGRAPDDDLVAMWLAALQEDLGDLDPVRLKASLKAAWTEHRNGGGFGSIVPADVVAQYRRGSGRPTFAEAMPADCSKCREGLVTMRRPGTTETFVAPCGCLAGDVRRKLQPAVFGRSTAFQALLERGCSVVAEFEVVQ